MKNKKKGILIAVAVAVIVVIAVAAVCLNRKTDNAGAVSEGRTESADKTKKSDKADKEESENKRNSDAQVITFAVPDICKIDKNNLKKFNDALAADGHDYELEIKTLSYDNYGQAVEGALENGKTDIAFLGFGDAAGNNPDAYAKAADECGLELVSQPKINVTQLEAGKPFIFEAVVATKPEVEVGQYKGVEVTKADTEATDADVEEELKRVQEQNSRTVAVTDRAVKDGDNTVIDFEGFVDGVAFEGGKGTDYPLTIGSHSFIDTFEDQIIGMNIGDEKEINVTFPEEYHVDDLKGKPAMFKVSVKEIKEKQLPELNDEFAQDVSDFDTIAEYKDDLKNKIADRKSREAKAKQEDEAIAKIIEDSKMDIPDAMVDTQVNRMVEDFAQRLQQQGLSVEQYFQYTGMTADKIMEEMKPEAVKRIQSRLVLEAVVKAENIETSEEDFEAELKKMAETYKMELDQIKEFMGDYEKKKIKEDLAIQKAIEVITGSVVEK